MLLNFIRPVGNSIHKIYKPRGTKLLTRLRLGFAHVLEHIFRHNFADTLNPLCSCSLETESTLHFFTRPKLYYFTQSPYDRFKKYWWCHYVFEWRWPTSCYTVRKQEFWQQHKQNILTPIIKIVKDTERFEQPIF